MEFLDWLENSGLGQWVASDDYAEPILLCFHAVGMGLVVGLTWMLSLRVLGFPKGLSLRSFESLTRLSGIGFLMNAISGVLLFCSEATRLIINTDFQVKILCIVLGAYSLWALKRTLDEVDIDDGALRFSMKSKVLAVVTFSLWLIAIVAGRYIAYTLAPPAL